MPAVTVMSAYNDQYNAALNRTEPEIVPIEFLNSTYPNEFIVSAFIIYSFTCYYESTH